MTSRRFVETANPPASRIIGRIVWATLTIVPLLATWTFWYTHSYFPQIDPSIGGGKHPSGTVVLRQPEKGDEKYLGMALGAIALNDLSTEKVIIVLVDADFVVVASPKDKEKSKTVMVAKKLIASIRYH